MCRTIAIVLALLITTATARATPLAPSKPSQIVNLSNKPVGLACPMGGTEFTEVIKADGTSAPFAGIPTGQVLVITSWEWTAGTGPVATLEAQTASTRNILAESFVVGTGAGGMQTFPTGIVVQPGVHICIGSVGPFGSAGAHVHGFLTNDK